MTNEEIEDVIQDLYAWAAKRDATNRTREGEPNFRKLDNTLLKKAIKTIQLLAGERRPTEDAEENRTRRRL